MSLTKSQIKALNTIAFGNKLGDKFDGRYFRTDSGFGIMSMGCLGVFTPEPVPGLTEMREDGNTIHRTVQETLDRSYLVDFRKEDMVNWKQKYKEDRAKKEKTTRITLRTVDNLRASESQTGDFDYVMLMRLIHAVGGTPELRLARIGKAAGLSAVLALPQDWDWQDRETMDRELTYGILYPLRPKD